jgi:hypothetical protein
MVFHCRKTHVNSKPEVAAHNPRDLRFDTLRGLFLVLMTVNHLPTEIRRVTDQPLGLFSAAEGFVFLSGLMAGWIYTRRMRRSGPGAVWSAAFARAKSIYLWHIGGFLATLAVVQLTYHLLGFVSTSSPRLFSENPLAALGLGLTFLYQPGLLDLLPMYCVFVLLLPVVLVTLEAGGRRWVLAVSTLVWATVQAAPPMAGVRLGLVNTGIFNLFAWQFLFVAGIVIGHAKARGENLVGRPSRLVIAGAAALVAYGLGIRHLGWGPVWPDRIYGILLNKPALGLLRMGDFACVAYLVALLGARVPALLTSPSLSLLGRHSLLVVASQSVLILTLLQFPELFDTPLSRTLTAASTVGILFILAALRDMETRSDDAPAALAPDQTALPG